MADLVEDIKRAGARVAGLTDTSPVHLELLQRYPAVRSLEAVVASCVTGFRKPSAEAFRAAMARLGVAPEDVYYTTTFRRTSTAPEPWACARTCSAEPRLCGRPLGSSAPHVRAEGLPRGFPAPLGHTGSAGLVPGHACAVGS